MGGKKKIFFVMFCWMGMCFMEGVKMFSVVEFINVVNVMGGFVEWEN